MKSTHSPEGIPVGTRVRLADGSERPIETLRLGERVLSAEGTPSRVTCLSLAESEPEVLQLVIWGHSHLRVASQQIIITARGPVKACDLAPNDEIAMTKWLPETRSSTATDQYVVRSSSRLPRGNRWQGLPGRKGLRVDANPVPESIDLDENFGRVIGLFLAEGHCTDGKASFSFCIDELDTLVAETVSRMGEYGVTPHVRPVPSRNGCHVSVYGTAWTRIFSSLCGDGAGFKRIHPDLTAGPRVFLAGVLSGWMDGDGHVNKQGLRVGVTISSALALGMFDIAQALGHHPVINRSLPSANGAAKTRQPRWTVGIAQGQGRCRQDEKYVWRKLRETRAEAYSGSLYGMALQSAGSYVAEGVAVANDLG